MPLAGVHDECISLLPLILQTYELEDEGDICWIEDVPATVMQTTYKEVVASPEKVFDLKIFNRRLLKPEYRILFNIVRKVFMAFYGTHESMTLPKFKCITAIVQILKINS